VTLKPVRHRLSTILRYSTFYPHCHCHCHCHPNFRTVPNTARKHDNYLEDKRKDTECAGIQLAFSESCWRALLTCRTLFHNPLIRRCAYTVHTTNSIQHHRQIKKKEIPRNKKQKYFIGLHANSSKTLNKTYRFIRR